MKSVGRFLWMKETVLFLLLVGCAPQAISNSPNSPTVTPSASSTRSLELAETPQSEPSETLNATQADPDIWTQMRQGRGYVVLLRHAETVEGTGDPPGFQIDDCTTQRNLSEAGREQAARIGQAFRDRDIPIHRVISSQYCRCLDTAKLLDLGDVLPSPMLNSTFSDRTTEIEQTEQVRRQIFNHRNTDGVIVIVSHFTNIGAISGVNPQEGGMVVMRTDSQGELEVVAQIQDL
ncbi:MAG: histidine phosphatase family protein [Cyanobacteria bacterium CRU_2_1]|nr:histidine phosphatase family protein [Cyanobacteria bacterium CRU_2_1]